MPSVPSPFERTRLFCLCRIEQCFCDELVEASPSIIIAVATNTPYVIECQPCAEGWHVPFLGGPRVWYPHPDDPSPERDPAAPTH